jgi:hypothetical protein
MPDEPLTPEEFIQAMMEHVDREGELDPGHMTAVLRIVAAYTESIRREARRDMREAAAELIDGVLREMESPGIGYSLGNHIRALKIGEPE